MTAEDVRRVIAATPEVRSWQHDGMMCEVLRAEVDFAFHFGVLWMVKGDCCDMSGCIDFFRAIDPQVQHISTISGDVIDTCYRLDLGEWVAYDSAGIWR